MTSEEESPFRKDKDEKGRAISRAETMVIGFALGVVFTSILLVSLM